VSYCYTLIDRHHHQSGYCYRCLIQRMMTLTRGMSWQPTNKKNAIPVDDDPLHWWCSRASSYKKLKPIAFKYLSTPATTVPCERLFSLAGNVLVVSRRRASLNPTNVQKLVCLASWHSKDLHMDDFEDDD
jgi:hypothetical protein